MSKVSAVVVEPEKQVGVVVPFLRTPYNYDMMKVSNETGLFCPEPSLTKQEFTRECDPNFILDRFSKGADISAVLNSREPRYGDFTNMPQSYHEALNFIKETEQSFMELDAHVRAQFDNDPGKFLDFVSNPENVDKVVELGLAIPKAIQDAVDASAPPPADSDDSRSDKAPKGAKKVPAKAGSDSPSE